MGNVFSCSISCDAFFSRCLDCTVKRAAYLSELEDNLAVLQTDLQKLTEARNDVMRRVIYDEKQQKIRTDQVQGWLSRVEEVEAEVGEIQKAKSQEIEKLCLGRYCSKTYKSSYKFGKDVAKLLQVVATLKAEGTLEVVAVRTPETAVDERPCEPTVGLESTFDQVWRCLEEEGAGIIGLYGMGGVGKTTLLTQINNKFCDTPNDFDFVIWVVVSKQQRVEKIQEDIGKKIGLFNESWKCKDHEEKAVDILKIMRTKKFILLLDDIWEWVNLAEVVPLSRPESKFKIVFTTRFLDVCCQMGAHDKFEVQCLADEEACKLFQEKLGIGIFDSHPDVSGLARIVVKECRGLPLALITIGREMAGKMRREEWEYAIEVLRTSPSKFSGMEEKVYSRLKFSYDSLSGEAVRSCFLYCSLFPEDYSINKEDLIDYWVGEGFLDGRNHGYSVMCDLIRACLLEEAVVPIVVGSVDYPEEERVKLHDVMRDMALWIASEIEKEKGSYLVVSNAELTEVPEIGNWEGVRRIYLMENVIGNLSEAPKCHDLVNFIC